MNTRPYTRRSPAQWQQYIDDQPASGLTIAAYCQHHQLATSNFYYWRSKLNSRVASTVESAEDDWLAMPAASSSLTQMDETRAKVTLSLPGGITLSIESA